MNSSNFYFCEDQSNYGLFRIMPIAGWNKNRSFIDNLCIDAEILDLLPEGFINEGAGIFKYYVEGPCEEMCCRDEFTTYGKKLLLDAGFMYSKEMNDIINIEDC